VTSQPYGERIGRGSSTVSRIRLLVASGAPAAAAPEMHPRFAATGINAKVWPLSPEDWSTG
jgi:hypothetical protein